MLLNALKLKLSLQIAGFDARLHAVRLARAASRPRAANSTRASRPRRGREVMLVGHSMGGVVARVALGRQTRGRIARVVQLGAPNHGSFAPVLALRGVYPTVRKLAALDRRHDAEDLARIVFRTLPSLHELLPDPRLGRWLDLFDAAAWPDDALRPDPQLLADAAAARARWPAADERCLHIVGVRQETVTRAGAARRASSTTRSSRRATAPCRWRSPMLPGAAHWYVGEKHGGLPNNGTRHRARSWTCCAPATPSGCRPSSRRAASRDARVVSETALRRVAPHKVQLAAPVARRTATPARAGRLAGVPRRRRAGRRSSALRAQATAARVRGGTAHARAPARARQHRRRQCARARARRVPQRRSVGPGGGASTRARRRHPRVHAAAHVRGQPRAGRPPCRSPRGRLLAELVLFAGLGDFDDFGADAQAFVAGNIVRTLARSAASRTSRPCCSARDRACPSRWRSSSSCADSSPGCSDADPDGVVRRITICEIDARKYAALRARRCRGWLQRLSDDEPAPRGRRRRRVRHRAPAPEATPAARRRCAADPAYLLVTMIEQGRSDYECRSVAAHGRREGGGAERHGTLSAQACARTSRRSSPAARAARPGAHRRRARTRCCCPRRCAKASRRCARRPLVVVHDAEASRMPWEVLRVGDVASGARGRPQSSLRERHADRRALARAARRAARRCACC